ncbi:hypothetical protein [Streptomyces rubellomurinus]|uniref:Uncharacterized protein n=2 Tax=Streptomyces TaxID=1883 RepID=A0A0F2TIW5_STRR3|nr:hypothetical protein [Streptomyces rubellomurinus]KJS53464.1 hypothetical protein VM98_25045 [Streptomyces rubellomurinus subsp. indigoferus]KJS62225.1 hypothetical protein VM95_10225 [Streptomyces rubellomurinus]
MQPAFVISGLIGFVFGLLWIALSVVQGHRDRRSPLPPLVLCGIFAWDGFMLFGVTTAWSLTYAFEPFLVAFEIYLFWLFWRYGPADYPGVPRRRLMLSVLIALVVTATAFQLAGRALGDQYGVTTGMILQTATPVLCLAQLRRRGSAIGQSVPGAACLLIALTALSVGAVAAPPGGGHRQLNLCLGVAQVVLQAAYLRSLTGIARAERDADRAAGGLPVGTRPTPHGEPDI